MLNAKSDEVKEKWKFSQEQSYRQLVRGEGRGWEQCYRQLVRGEGRGWEQCYRQLVRGREELRTVLQTA